MFTAPKFSAYQMYPSVSLIFICVVEYTDMYVQVICHRDGAYRKQILGSDLMHVPNLCHQNT